MNIHSICIQVQMQKALTYKDYNQVVPGRAGDGGKEEGRGRKGETGSQKEGSADTKDACGPITRYLLPGKLFPTLLNPLATERDENGTGSLHSRPALAEGGGTGTCLPRPPHAVCGEALPSLDGPSGSPGHPALRWATSPVVSLPPNSLALLKPQSSFKCADPSPLHPSYQEPLEVPTALSTGTLPVWGLLALPPRSPAAAPSGLVPCPDPGEHPSFLSWNPSASQDGDTHVSSGLSSNLSDP